MLDPIWALTRPILWLALTVLVALLVLRTIRKDRKEYQRFKRYRTTAKRQAMYRRWLLDSFLSFGGLSVVLLLLAGQFVAPLLQELVAWPGLRDIRALIADNTGFAISAVIGLTLGIAALTMLGVRAARKEQEIMAVGDIRSMLPRNRQELRLGALLSINAGVVEELVFRLALPAAIYGASGSALAAVLGSVLLFGALHLYQGVTGVIGTSVVGAVFMALYVISGTIAVPILLHVIFDLRSLVLIPAAIYRVHRIDGTEKPFIGVLAVPAAVPVPVPMPVPAPEPAPTSEV